MRYLLLTSLMVCVGCGGTEAAHGGDGGSGGDGATSGDLAGADFAGVDLSTMNGSGAFPSTSIFYQDISNAAPDNDSGNVMTAIAGAWPLRVDVSFTILTADPSVPRSSFVNMGDTPDCDTSPVPLPPGGNIEGETNYHCASGGDCHLLVYQGTRLYELYQADVPDGTTDGVGFTGGCLVVWDLTHDYWQPMNPPNFSRGDHCNGADAADMPMAPLIITKEDIQSGEIKHAMRFTIPNSYIQPSIYVHPATHTGVTGTGTGPILPYGARLRLKQSYDVTKISDPGARVIATALQRYGMFMDDGGNLFVSATVDVADVADPAGLKSIPADQFEMVDGGTRYNWHDYQCNRTVVSN